MFRRLVMCLAILAALALPAICRAEGPAEGGQPAPAGSSGGEVHQEPKHEVIEFDAATAVWVIVIFVVLLAILYPTAWKSVLAGLKAREARIRKDITDAEAAREKAEATLREYSERLAQVESKVREMLQSASVEGEKLAAGIRTRAQQEAEEAKERATRDIEAARKQAIKQIYAEAAELSTSIAEKILRRNLNPADQEDLVRSSLQELPANV